MLNKLKRNTSLIYIVGVILIAAFFKTKQSLLNYPTEFSLVLIIGAFLIINVLLFQRTLLAFKQGVIELALSVVQSIILSWVIASILLLPFNIWLTIDLENSQKEFVRAPIRKITTYSKNRCFYYEYNNELEVYYGYKSIMEIAKDNPSDYFVQLEVKQGKFDVYKILSWDMYLK